MGEHDADAERYRHLQVQLHQHRLEDRHLRRWRRDGRVPRRQEGKILRRLLGPDQHHLQRGRLLQDGPPKGKHTLELVATATRNPEHGAGDTWTILDRSIVDGKTILEDSPRISYDGWVGRVNRRAYGGTCCESTSQTLGARGG